MNKWFQDGQPSSYKIQVLYVDIPEHLQLKKKTVDTPFRFRSFEEAQRASMDIFNGYEVQIVGSIDKPHWQEPDARMSGQELQKENWYDIYGVTPAYQTQYNREKQLHMQSSENDATFKDLQKLKPMILPKTMSALKNQPRQMTQTQKQTKQIA